MFTAVFSLPHRVNSLLVLNMFYVAIPAHFMFLQVVEPTTPDTQPSEKKGT